MYYDDDAGMKESRRLIISENVEGSPDHLTDSPRTDRTIDDPSKLGLTHACMHAYMRMRVHVVI